MKARLILLATPVLWLTACTGINPAVDNGDGGGGGGGGADLAAGGGGGGGDDFGVGGGDDLSTGGGGQGCTGFKYCDDFESYSGAVNNNMQLGPWLASVTGTTVAVDSTNAYKSGKSLHITVPTGASAHGTLQQKAAGGLIPGNNMYGRAMVFYSNTGGNGLPLGVHSWIFSSSGDVTGGDGGTGAASMNMGGGGAMLQLNYHPPLPATEQSVRGGNITAGQWHCIQWQYDGGGSPPANIAKVWIDGTLAVDVPVSKGWEFPTPWNNFQFGFTHYQTLANTVEVFLDDFALDGKMIPCP